MTTFSYTIPKITESQNVYQRWHHMVRNREKLAWAQWLMVRRNLSHHCQPGAHRWVSIESYRPRLITDKANLIGGAKGLVDAIVQCELLVDDSDDLATIEYSQALTSKSPLRGNRFFGKRLLVDVPIPCTVIAIADDI